MDGFNSIRLSEVCAVSYLHDIITEAFDVQINDKWYRLSEV